MTTFPRYTRLPQELQVEVRDVAFARKALKPLGPSARALVRYQSLAPLACVNKEWQLAVETMLFRRLMLFHPSHEKNLDSHLLAFSAIVTGIRRKLVGEIDLLISINLDSIYLPEPESVPSRRRYQDQLQTDQFDRCILGLYAVLKSWDTHQAKEGGISVAFLIDLDAISAGFSDGATAPGVWPLVRLVGEKLMGLPAVPVIREIIYLHVTGLISSSPHPCYSTDITKRPTWTPVLQGSIRIAVRETRNSFPRSCVSLPRPSSPKLHLTICVN